MVSSDGVAGHPLIARTHRKMQNEQNKTHSPADAAAQAPPQKGWPGKSPFRFVPWFVLGCSLLITGLVWHGSRTTLDQATQDYFEFRVREAATRIVQRMQAYEQVLLGVQGLYKSSVSVERHEFRTYVESLQLADNYPGIQGVGFSLIVPARAKDRHLAEIRREGFPKYTIYPAGQRDIYTSIIYLEPFRDRNLRAFGYDMYAEPVRRAAMEAARDNDRTAMSGKVRLVQESGKEEQAGFLIYLPVYRNGRPHGTTAERRATILGWAYAPFRMNDLMQGIHGERASDLHIKIYDGTEATAASLMYDSDETITDAADAPPSLSSKSTIEIAGHPWILLIHAHKGLHGRIDSRRPYLLAVSGLMISLLLTWLTWSLVTGQERAISALRERERLIADLHQALSEIKTLKGILPICSVCKKIRDDKDAWKQMETYISDHSDAVFSHGYCPECAQKALEEIQELTEKHMRKPDPQSK